MMKKGYLLILMLLMVTLAGCHQQTQQRTHNSNADSASSISRASGQSDQANFKPSKAQTASPNYQPNGPLTQPGKFRFDQVGTKTTLNNTRKSQATIRQQGFTYQIRSTKLIQNQALTAQARKMAATAFHLETVKSPYYILVVNWTITNHTRTPLTTDGVAAISVAHQPAATPAGGLNDTSPGQLIPAHGKLNTHATALLSQTTPPKNHQATIQFLAAYDQQHHRQVAPSSTLTFAF